MISIIEALGKNYKNIILEDNESLNGGISFINETLENFMKECNIKETDDYGELCIKLEQNGIKSIRPLKYIELDKENNNKRIKNSKINKTRKEITEMNFKELLNIDISICKDLINNNIDKLYYDKNSCAWYIGGEEIVDELWYENNTILHPKELIGYIEEYIEKELKICR